MTPSVPRIRISNLLSLGVFGNSPFTNITAAVERNIVAKRQTRESKASLGKVKLAAENPVMSHMSSATFVR
jgi:hypothetical protein